LTHKFCIWMKQNTNILPTLSLEMCLSNVPWTKELMIFFCRMVSFLKITNFAFPSPLSSFIATGVSCRWDHGTLWMWQDLRHAFHTLVLATNEAIHGTPSSTMHHMHSS
jgi:hypothetical protein